MRVALVRELDGISSVELRERPDPTPQRSLDADVTRQTLEAIGGLVEAGRLRPQIEAVLPFEQVREALERVAGRHTRGKIVLQIG
jgi:NADPH:quinone reductase-like Zn-dependent oxidoreductase